jgi:hypothetical protein
MVSSILSLLYLALSESADVNEEVLAKTTIVDETVLAGSEEGEDPSLAVAQYHAGPAVRS